jgi:hypothetical protein
MHGTTIKKKYRQSCWVVLIFKALQFALRSGTQNVKAAGLLNLYSLKNW